MFADPEKTVGSSVSASMTTNLWWMYTSGGCRLSPSSPASSPVASSTAVRIDDTSHQNPPGCLPLRKSSLLSLLVQRRQGGRLPGVEQVGLAGESLGGEVRRPGEDGLRPRGPDPDDELVVHEVRVRPRGERQVRPLPEPIDRGRVRVVLGR